MGAHYVPKVTPESVGKLKDYSVQVDGELQQKKVLLLREIKGYHKMCKDHNMSVANVKDAMKKFKGDLEGSIGKVQGEWDTGRKLWHEGEATQPASVEDTDLLDASRRTDAKNAYKDIAEFFHL